MNQFLKDALEFAVKKAKSEQDIKEIKKNFKEIVQIIEKSKDDRESPSLSTFIWCQMKRRSLCSKTRRSA